LKEVGEKIGKIEEKGNRRRRSQFLQSKNLEGEVMSEL